MSEQQMTNEHEHSVLRGEEVRLLREEIERLRGQVTRLQSEGTAELLKHRDERYAKDLRIAELEGVLRPIAEWYEKTIKANQWMTSTNNPLEPSFDRVAQDWDLTLDDIRKAAAALAGKGVIRG